MLFAGSVFVGVDTTSAHKAFTYAALDRSLNVVALADGELDEVAAFLGGQESALVAVNAPSHLNRGLVRKSREPEASAPPRLRGVDLRVAEHELRQRGIPVSGTSSRESLCPAWMRIGLSLYARLADLDYQAYPEEGCPRQWIETHPHAGYWVLLERSPLPKPMLEGRMQRQLVLYERGVRVRDPMDLLEEITRHKLLNGILPADILYLPEQLDALLAAYTAWLAAQKPAELSRLGATEEGFIHLPVRHLRERYES